MRQDIQKILREGEQYLLSCGVPFPDREAIYILLEMFHLQKVSDLSRLERVSEDELEKFFAFVERRGKREPIEYIFGRTSFGGLSFDISQDVLIPRQETEILVNKLCQDLQKRKDIRVFRDVCCGSGCLGLIVKKRLPNLHVVLSDISPAALLVAQKNAEKNGLDVEFVLGDLFEPFDSPCEAFVCNPPYLSFDEIHQTDPEVRCFEPWLALVAGSQGYAFFERIALGLEDFLSPRGVGWLEIGGVQGDRVKEIFEKKGVRVILEKDWAGHDRFIQVIRGPF